MKIGKNNIQLFILLFAVSSLLVHFPSEAFAVAGDGSIDSTAEINDSTANGPVLSDLDHFGWSVANIGDLNNDGVNDIAVSAHLDDHGGDRRGALHIMFMNTDGSVDSTVEINDSTANGPSLADKDHFGRAFANIGDLNNDGVNDIAVGARGDDNGGSNRGALHIMFMNTDGSIDSTVEINSSTTNGPTLANGDRFGVSVANIGDLDGDGVNDIAVGAHLDDHGGDRRGALHIMFMNTDGSVDSTVEINSSTTNGPTLANGDRFVTSVANIGDLDGDGVNDIVGGGGNALHIMFMNTDGSIDSTVEINSSTANGPSLANGDFFGVSVANIGDLDGNGVNDIAGGAWGDDHGGSNRGALHIMFMNTNGSVDSTVEINDSTANGPSLANEDFFGISVANIGDLDGNGVNDIAVGAPGDDHGGDRRGALHIMFMAGGVVIKSNDCYDCEPPRLVKVQVGITSNKNASDDSMTHVMKEEYVWNFPINAPLSMRDDNITKITANPGDEIEITLDVIDDKSVHLLPTSGIYTNFMERPNNMNLFFANNFDESHNTSTSFYEWNRNHDDVAYDYADTVTWRNPDISYTQFPVTTQTPFELLNDELVIEHFIISFKMKFTDSMKSSQVWVSAADYYGQTFKVSLPLTLEILGDEPLDFTSYLNQKVLGYFNEPVLLSMLYQWSETSEDASELSSILGVDGELPQWTANLATWTVEEKITLAEMIIAIEHVINQ